MRGARPTISVEDGRLIVRTGKYLGGSIAVNKGQYVSAEKVDTILVNGQEIKVDEGSPSIQLLFREKT